MHVMAEGDKQLNVDSIIQRLLEGTESFIVHSSPSSLV